MNNKKASSARVGDIFVRPGELKKPRPLVVVGFIQSEVGRSALCIPLTTSSEWGVIRAHSRFLERESYFTNQIEAVGINAVLYNIVGVYEDLSYLKKVKKTVTKNILEALKV